MKISHITNEDAAGLNIGDPVVITGNVQFKGKTGDIVDFGKDNRFVIVNLYNYGKHSFHASDVSYNEYAESGDEQEYLSQFESKESKKTGTKFVGQLKGTDPASKVKSKLVGEAKKPSDNFTIDDIKELEQMKSLENMKQRAYELISTRSAKPMKPEKLEWFKRHIENIPSPMKLIKLMYDLLLAGEGLKVFGGTNTTNPNSYRARFGEALEEAKSLQSKFEKHLAKNGYDVAEKGRYWEQKLKDIDAQIKAWDAEMAARKAKQVKTTTEGDELDVGIEAYGVRGMNSKKWRKKFKSQAAFERWLDANQDDVEVLGTREINLNDMFEQGVAEDAHSQAAKEIHDNLFQGTLNAVDQKNFILSVLKAHGLTPADASQVINLVRKLGYAGNKFKQQGVSEAKSLAKRVRVVKTGETGTIRQVKHGAYKGAAKTYYVDLDNGGQADNLPASALRLIKQGVAESEDANFTKWMRQNYPGAAKSAETYAKAKKAYAQHLRTKYKDHPAYKEGVAEGGEWDEYTGGAPFPDTDDLDTYSGEHDPDDLDESSGTEYRGFDIRASREYGTGEVVYWIYYRGRCTEHGSRTLNGAKKDIDQLIASGFFNDPDEIARKKQHGLAEGSEQTINIGDDVVITGNSAYAGVTGRVIGFREGKIVVDMLEQGKVRFAPERVKLYTPDEQGVTEAADTHTYYIVNSDTNKNMDGPFDSREEAEKVYDRMIARVGNGNMKKNFKIQKKQGVAEGMGAYDNDKGIKHTRESLVAKLESLPKGDDDFEWNRIQAIQHLKQGNPLRARYYMAKMKRGEQGVAEGFLGDREYNRVMPFVKRIASEVSDYDRDEFGEELWSLLDQKYGPKFAQSVLDDIDFYWDTYTELTDQQGVAEGEYDPSYDPDYRPYQKPEQDPDAWKQQRDLEEPATPTTVTVRDAEGNVVLEFPSTGGYYGDVRMALSKGFDTESGDYDIKWQKNEDAMMSENAGVTSEQVASAIVRRIIFKHKDAISAFGPEAIMAAAREVGEYFAGSDDLGTSDIGIATKYTLEKLDQMSRGELDESASGGATGAGAVAATPAGGTGKNVGSLFGGTYKQKRTKKSPGTK